VARFLAGARGRAAGPTIAALRARFEAVARAEIERVQGTVPGADERLPRALRALADGMLAKLLHSPMVALKKDAGVDGEGNLVDAAHKLFGLAPLQAMGDDGEKDAGGDGDPADEGKKVSSP
jgi:glutamyl-tRNA reductase